MSDGREEMGQRVRREVLGDEHVDAALGAGGEFERPLQEMLHDFAWGGVWSRSGLDRRTRSLLSVALLAAADHDRELALHVRGALRNGATEQEIAETLLHVGVYCGMPAAVGAFRVARDVLDGLAS